MFRRAIARLRSLWNASRKDSDLNEEIAFHLSEEAEERAAAGVPTEEAQWAARRDFGNVLLVRETTQEVWRWGGVDRLLQDVRQGIRTLLATPLVTAVIVVSLALGIGANTAMFSIMDALLLRALPVADPHQLVLLRDGNGRRTHWTNPIWEEIRERQGIFDGTFAWSNARFNLSRSGPTDLVDGLWVSGGMFEMLGVPAILGRPLSPEDDARGGGRYGPVAVISYHFWHERYGGAADAVGQLITVERVPFTIVGVTPPAFFGPEVGRTFDVAIPIGTEPLIRGKESALDHRSHWWLQIMIRLKADQTPVQGNALLRALHPQIREATLPQDWPPDMQARYLQDGLGAIPVAGASELRTRYGRPVTTLMIVVACVLLIACANIANLLLGRAMARRHEMSVRLALGASRLRLLRQLLTESLMLAAAGALAGLLFAHWSSRILLRHMSTAANPVFLDLSVDTRMLAFAAAVAVLTAVLFGLAPALRATRGQPQDALRSQGRGLIGPSGFGGHALVVLQVALSLVLVVTAALLVRTFSSLATLDLGLEPDPVLIAAVALPHGTVEGSHRPELFNRMLDAAGTVPGVASVALSEVVPVTGNTWNEVVELPHAPDMPEDQRLTWINRLSPGWFGTYGIRLIAGRDFTDEDTRGALPVAIVNQTFAQRFTAGRNPVGTRVRHRGVDRDIVGYVQDAVYSSVREAIPPTLYIPYSQETTLPPNTFVTVRAAAGSPALLMKPIAEVLGQVHGDIALTFRPLTDHVNAAVAQERLLAWVAGFFGVLSLVLAALGLYGVTSYAVNSRWREIGVRVALGAAPSGVVRLLLRRVALLVSVGIVLGIVGSVWASRFVSTLLFGLEPGDPATLAGSILVLATVAALAGWLPARRAARIDPAAVLREG